MAGSIAAQGGIWSFGLQAAKIGREGTFVDGAVTWYQHPAPRVALGTIQEQQPFPPEVGGTIVTKGMYKQGFYGVAQVDMIPRLTASFGWLLKATMGTASSTLNKDADGVTVTGINTHIFRFNPSESAAQPWVATKRLVPGSVPADNYGETLFDGKVNSLRLTVPGKGKIAGQIGIIARDVKHITNPTWVYANTNENTDHTADAGSGGAFIGGVKYPITAASIDIMNMLSTPDQEAIIGDFRMDDMIALSRAAQIKIVYKYEDSTLYRKLVTGTASGTDYSNIPFTNNQDGTGYAFDFRFKTPAVIGATAANYEIRFRAGRIVWSVDGPIELAGQSIVQQTFTGTIVEPAAGQDFLQIVLVNGQASY